MKVNFGIQLLPLKIENKVAIIDKAIHCIQNSGLVYKVCPLETVVEGELQDCLDLVKKIHDLALEECSEIMVYMKLHSRKDKDALIQDKMQKWD